VLDALSNNPQRRNQLLIFLGLIGVVFAALGISLLGLDVIDLLIAAIAVILIAYRPFVGLLLLAFTIPIDALFVYGGEVTLEFRCDVCGYWTGKKKKIPTLNFFYASLKYPESYASILKRVIFLIHRSI